MFNKILQLKSKSHTMKLQRFLYITFYWWGRGWTAETCRRKW